MTNDFIVDEDEIGEHGGLSRFYTYRTSWFYPYNYFEGRYSMHFVKNNKDKTSTIIVSWIS